MKEFLAYPVVLILLLGTGTPAFADFQKGLDAVNRGDFATALKEWKPLAEQGHAEAQYNLGVMYDRGEGVTQDDKAALKWYKRAAEQGDADAQNNLGFMYNHGQGVTQDDKAAIKWYKLAAEQGFPVAHYHLGNLYFNGHGVSQDYARAYMWWNIAASKGYTDAVAGRTAVQNVMTPTQIEKA